MTTTNREYAEALFELAIQAEQADETTAGLETVISAVMQAPEFGQLLASPAIGKVKRIQALDEAFGGKVPQVLMGVLRMMVSRGHISGLEAMGREYDALVRQYRGESVAYVTSAVPLKEAEAVAIRQEMENRIGHGVTLQCRVDPSLIGGVRVEMDGRVIDGSIRNKLEQIKEVMNS